MAVLYQSGRDVLPSNAWTITVGSGGSLTANTYYFSLQANNRVGTNAQLISIPITVVNNNKITITVEEEALNDGEGWLYYTLGVSSTNNPLDFTQIAQIWRVDPTDFTVANTFPLSLEITLDDQLNSDLIVATPANLPDDDLLEGAIRTVTSTGFYYEYRSYSTATVDNVSVLNAVAPSTGRWHVIGNNNVYIESSFATGGSSVDIRYLSNTSGVLLSNYVPDGTRSEEIQIWLTNDGSFAVEAGTFVNLSFYLGGLDKSKLFDKRVYLTNRGYVDLTTGIIRDYYTSNNLLAMPSVGIEETYSWINPVIRLDDDLEPGEAIVIGVSLEFNAAEVEGYIAETTLNILPEFVPIAGSYVPFGSVFGDGLILAEYDYCRIVPSYDLTATKLRGSGVIKSYSFTNIKENLVFDILANTANQTIAINKNGIAYHTTFSIAQDAVQRALVSTVAGQSKATTFSPVGLTANQSIDIVIEHPCDTEQKGTIRSTYPDVIANNTKGIFNPESINVYIKRVSDGEIRLYNFPIVRDETQTINIQAFNGSVTGAPPTSDFGLYEPISATPTSNGVGTFAAGSYEVAITYVYDGNQITGIDHKTTSGCVTESVFTFSELFAFKYWLDPLPLKSSITDISVDYLREGVVVLCLENGFIYRYDPASVEVVDNDQVLAVTNSTGRWLVVSAGGTNGGGDPGGGASLTEEVTYQGNNSNTYLYLLFNNNRIDTSQSAFTLSPNGAGTYTYDNSLFVEGTHSAILSNGLITNNDEVIEFALKDFCVEGFFTIPNEFYEWYFYKVFNAYIYCWGPGGGDYRFDIYVNFTATPYYYISGSVIIPFTSIGADTFRHLAFVRDKGVFKLFLEGVQLWENAEAIDLSVKPSVLGEYINLGPGGDTSPDTMRLDAYRISVDTPVYTSNFTPNTTGYTYTVEEPIELDNIANVEILSNNVLVGKTKKINLVDENGVVFKPVVNNNNIDVIASVPSLIKANPIYTPSANLRLLLDFRGVADGQYTSYLDKSGNNYNWTGFTGNITRVFNEKLVLGEGDQIERLWPTAWNTSNLNFCLEMLVDFTSIVDTDVSLWDQQSGNVNYKIIAYQNGSALEVWANIQNTGAAVAWLQLGTITNTLSSYHIALVRNGTNIIGYINGTQTATASIGTESIFDATVQNTVKVKIARNAGPSFNLHYVRLTINDPVYTAAFTPPTSLGSTELIYPNTTPTEVITSATILKSNRCYLCNTSGGAFPVTTPANPTNGDFLEIGDYSSTSAANGFATNNLTITANAGHNVNGNATLVLSTGGVGARLRYFNNRWSRI